MDHDRLYTVPEVADLFSVRHEAVRRWLRDGRLRGHKLGGSRTGYRIAESDVKRFREETRTTVA